MRANAALVNVATLRRRSGDDRAKRAPSASLRSSVTGRALAIRGSRDVVANGALVRAKAGLEREVRRRRVPRTRVVDTNHSKRRY